MKVLTKIAVQERVCVQTQVMKKKSLHFISLILVRATGNTVKHNTQSSRPTCARIHVHKLFVFADRKGGKKGPKRFRPTAVLNIFMIKD